MRLPGGLKQQDTTPPCPLEAERGGGVTRAQAKGPPRESWNSGGPETEMLPKVEKKGEKHLPASHPPDSGQCLSLAEFRWNLADF